MLWLQRARPYAAILTAVAILAATITAAVAIMLSSLDAAVDEGVRRGLSALSGDDRALRVSLPLDAAAAEQDEQVRERIVQEFAGVASEPAISRIVLDTVSTPSEAGGDEVDLLVVSGDGLDAAITVVDGRLPRGADECAVLVDSPVLADVGVGDRMRVGERSLEVVGTWLVADPSNPAVLGDGRIPGDDPVDTSVILVDDDAWAGLAGTSPRSQWTIVPPVDLPTARDVDHVLRSWQDLRMELRADAGGVGQVGTSGGFADAAAALLVLGSSARAVVPAVVALLAAAALLTLVELARLLTADRSREYALLWARGRTPGAAALGAAAGAATAAVVGGTAGAGAALLLVAAGARAPLSPPWTAIACTIGAVALVVAVGAGVGAHRGSRPMSGVDLAESRARRLVTPVAAILVAVAAAIAVWQSSFYGTADRAAPGAVGDVDPIGAMAPALTLVAAILIGVSVAPAVAAGLERIGRRAAPTVVLASRSFSRSLWRVTATIVVIALAVGSSILAAAYQSTWTRSFDRAGAVIAGADVTVVAARGGLTVGAIDRVSAAPGVEEAYPVQVDAIQVGGEEASLVAVVPGALQDLAAATALEVDGATLGEALRIDDPGPALSGRADHLVLTIAASGFLRTPRISFIVRDDRGVLLRLEADVERAEDGAAGLVASARLDDHLRGGDARLLAIDVDLPPGGIADGGALFAPDAWPEDPALDGITWSPRREATFVVATPVDGGGFRAQPGVERVRLLPDGPPTSRPDQPPIAISQELATTYGLEPGDRLSFGIERSSARIEAVVVDVIPAVPSAPTAAAVLMDLAVVQVDAVLTGEFSRAPDLLWITAEGASAVAEDVDRASPPSSTVVIAEDPIRRQVTGPTVGVLWSAAALCALLAVVTFIAVAGAVGRARRREVAVLRALGMAARAQAAGRALEWTAVVLLGLVIGLVAGTAAAALTVVPLTRAALPQAPDTLIGAPSVDLPSLAAGIVALVCVVAIAALGDCVRVARAARSSGGPEARG